MGEHSGYDLLCRWLEKLIPGKSESVFRKEGLQDNAFGCKDITQVLPKAGSPFYNSASAWAEYEVLLSLGKEHSDLVHILYVENNLGILASRLQEKKTHIIGTVHQPPSWWQAFHRNPEVLADLAGLIVVAYNQIEYFKQYIPADRIYFIPHGVDIDFFSPDLQNGPFLLSKPRCVFVGRWLRDFALLSKVINSVVQLNPCIQFDLLVPEKDRPVECMAILSQYEQVHWHENLTDEALRNLYRRATLLFLPLADCTANNTILEAIACGLPIITTDVGGIRNYVSESFADILPSDDHEGLLNAILRLLSSPAECEKRGAAAMVAAEKFSWKRVAKATWNVYKTV